MKVEKSSSAAATQKQETLQQKQLSQNRKSSVWSREKINQLIDLYKKHECLWDHWHVSYKNKDKRNRAIEDICTTLNVPKLEFGKKIHNLRNQFNTEMKKLEQRIEEAGVSLDDAIAMDLRCKWSHFESLMFLRNVIEPRPGVHQNVYQTPKKMRVRFDLSNSEDDLNVASMLHNNSSGSSNSTQHEDATQFQYDDNVTEEIITDDYQSFENEVIEVGETNCREEVCDQKYQPPIQLQNKQESSSSDSARNFSKSANKLKSQILTPTSSACNSSQTEVLNINDDSSSVIELSSNNLTVVSSHSNIASTSSSSSSLTTPLISSVSTSSSSNRPISIVRDQWDAFGELVANEFRNLNSEISRKRLKRKIMQAMLEVGEEDDNLMDNRLRNN